MLVPSYIFGTVHLQHLNLFPRLCTSTLSSPSEVLSSSPSHTRNFLLILKSSQMTLVGVRFSSLREVL